MAQCFPSSLLRIILLSSENVSIIAKHRAQDVTSSLFLFFYCGLILSVTLFFLLLVKHLTKRQSLLRYKNLPVKEGKENSALVNGITNMIRTLKNRIHGRVL